jgi:hypothetical protein
MDTFGIYRLKGIHMALPDALLAPLAALLDRIIPDPAQREQARQHLLILQGTPDYLAFQVQLYAALASQAAADPWTARARPCFLYVMYAMILAALPLGVLAAFQPQMAAAVAHGINAYLDGLPSPLYTLFGTGYLGYTAARQWGKRTGTDR